MSKSSGRYSIRFIGPDKRRRWLRLGEVSKRDAETVKGHLEAIVSAMIVGRLPPDDTQHWLAKLGDTMHGKLAAAGLVAERERATLGAFIDGYITGRADLKKNTVAKLQESRKLLVEFFGEHKLLSAITHGDGDEYRRWLASAKKLGDNTVRRQCGRAKQFFRAALRKRLIPESPFADMKDCSVRANKSRDYFLSRTDAAKILEACPDSQWRLIFALSRYGGLRCPSEHLALTWGDVDWATGKMLVRSPKTERHEGGESRVVPIFPELRPHLEAAFDEAPDGTIHVVTRYRDASQNLRTQFQRIIRRAGLEPWEKLFANLRATRATELTAKHPAHVAAAWLGHSAIVAQKHYWQVTDADFAMAAGNEANPVGHKPGHSTAELSGNTVQPATLAIDDCPVFPAISHHFPTLQSCTVPPVGLEPTT